MNVCRKKNFHRSPKLTLCVTCVLFFMITSKKFRRKKTIKREVVWLLLHVAFSAFLPFAAKSSQRHESKVGAAKSKTFLMFFNTNMFSINATCTIFCLYGADLGLLLHCCVEEIQINNPLNVLIKACYPPR